MLTQAVLETVLSESTETPLEYMMRVMADKTADTERRDRMAIAAAPYVHARKQEVEHKGEITRRVVSEPMSPEEWLEQVRSEQPLQ
jgi:hypothetical protein